MGTVNLSMPKITMEELEDDAKLQKILSYLYQLNEQLRYELTHIDDDNISGDGISEVSLTDSVSRTLKNDQGEVLELYMNARRMLLELSGKVDVSTEDLNKIAERMLKVEANNERLGIEVSEKVTQSQVEKTVSEATKDLATTEYVGKVELSAQQLKTEFSEMAIGDKNLLLNSGKDVTSADYLVAKYEPSSPLVAGKQYTIVVNLTPAEGLAYIRPYLSSGWKWLGEMAINGTSRQTVSLTVTAEYYEGMTPDVSAEHAKLYIYRFPNDGTVTGETTIHWIKCVEGNKATTDYSLPPEEFKNTAVEINRGGIEMNTTGSIRARVNDIEQLTIDQDGVSAKLVVADEVHAGNIVEMHTSATAEWKGGIQASLDALPKYLTQETTLTVPAGTYVENVSVKGFVGATLNIVLASGVRLNGTISINECASVTLKDTSGAARIYPQASGWCVIGIYNCQNVTMLGLKISGYRGRTASVAGTTVGVEVYNSNVTMTDCCIEYTSNYAYWQRRGTFYVANVSGGQDSSDASTNANLGFSVRAFEGAHGAIYGKVPMSVNGYSAAYATLIQASVTPTAGGMEYTEPEYVTETFSISKHCTYLYGVSRTRDDQSNLFSQGRYGTYEVASHTNYWRIGAMWFADAAAKLAGKTIQSATLKIRRGSGGLSNAVGVYLGKVALAESAFTSTLTPSFTAAATYPAGSLKRETEGTFDVTALMSAIQSGQALGVFEPRDDYSGSYSPAYTTFYGKGSNYEPTLTVTYK